jgi:transcriptional regulator with XRE-family HTH domain
MNKLQKIDHIKKVCQEEELTAYKIAQATGLSSVGVQKILNSETKNPNNSTIQIIMEFLENYVLGINNELVQEPEQNQKEDISDLKKYISCMETESKLRKEIHRLETILRKNKIEFDDDFES